MRTDVRRPCPVRPNTLGAHWGVVAWRWNEKTGMSDDQAADCGPSEDYGPSDDYGLWVKLANDPSQSEQARQQYRELMQAHVHQKLREAFKLAAQSAAPPPTK